MKVGNLVKCRNYPVENILGIVLEEQEDSEGNQGFWVEFFDDNQNWVWYSFKESHLSYWKHDLEVISEY